MIKPFFLCDLDDTLFQTKRKIIANGYTQAHTVAALDRQGQPRSFMTQKQSILVNWLLNSSTLIPVTARGTEELSRVVIPFTHHKISTHGAVILDENNQPESIWQKKIERQLAPYQQLLKDKHAYLTSRFSIAGINAWVRMITEYDGLNIYLVAKHTDSSKLDELYTLCDEIDKETGLEGFYVHRNSNNIAWLPNCIEKGLAASYLIDKIRLDHPLHPIIGLGDSISDYSFLEQCDWFGMPNKGQIKELVHQTIRS